MIRPFQPARHFLVLHRWRQALGGGLRGFVPTTICLLLVMFAISRPALAQQPVPAEEGWTGVQQALRRASHAGSLLHIVAHPDDEDGAMMAYVARGLGARTMLFSLTRGEGGANGISADFFDRLGILRTLEHQEAARYYGIELFYSRAVDYGFSKTLAEAQRTWQGGDEILEDLVRLIRSQRPLVVVARFRGDVRDGHGHHQMSGVLAQRAVAMAGDPQAYAEQITHDGLTPWSPRKLYHDNIQPQWRAEDAKHWTLALDVGHYDPMLGRSYAQIASHGLNFQRSQGMDGFPAEREARQSYYRRLIPPMSEDPTGATREVDFFDGLNVSTAGILDQLSKPVAPAARAQLERIDQILSELIGPPFEQSGLVFQDPAAVPRRLVEALVACREAMALGAPSSDFSTVDANFLRDALVGLRAELEEALARAIGLEMRCLVDSPAAVPARGGPRASEAGFEFATPGQSLAAALSISHAAPGAAIELVDLRLDADGIELADRQGSAPARSIPPLELWRERVELQVTPTAPVTRPYWQRRSLSESRYTFSPGVAARDRMRPFPAGPHFNVHMRVTLEGESYVVLESLTVPLTLRNRAADLGPHAYPLHIAPRVSVWLPVTQGVLPATATDFALRVEVRNHQLDPPAATVALELPAGWRSEPPHRDLRFTKPGEQTDITFRIQPNNVEGEWSYPISAVVDSQGDRFQEGFVTVTARDLSRFNYYQPAIYHVRVADLQYPADLHIGYVDGTGDDVASVLGTLKIDVQHLGPDELATMPLDPLDAIVIGVRAYAVRDDLKRYHQRLLDYVAAGGVLVVQYQTPEFDQNFGPYPYNMGPSPEEVSEEDAEVELLIPDHPLMNRPNRITADDFMGWVEQRGSKFWTTWDDRYQPLLACHDTDQPPQRGGLLYARHGKGAYIYSAYAWYRQLPQAVPGAFRLFLNQLSHRREL